MLFGKKKENKVMEAVNKVNESTREETKTETAKPVEEWIWVKGYKATQDDMTCRGYQYILGETHSMPDDYEIKECDTGFHLCRDLSDVFNYYSVGSGHRFFEVQALVRKSDYEKYGEMIDEPRPGYLFYYGPQRKDKLVAKSIVLVRELTPDEILENFVDLNEWTDDDKIFALNINIDCARDRIKSNCLTNLGYSQTFAQLIVDSGKYEIAKTAGEQPDLSMDMKCWLI